MHLIGQSGTYDALCQKRRLPWVKQWPQRYKPLLYEYKRSVVMCGNNKVTINFEFEKKIDFIFSDLSSNSI